jgi:hypothetical protein
VHVMFAFIPQIIFLVLLPLAKYTYLSHCAGDNRECDQTVVCLSETRAHLLVNIRFL